MRLFARDTQSGKRVKVTLRPNKIYSDLTEEELDAPAFFHENRKTVSGRLRTKNSNYIFERI